MSELEKEIIKKYEGEVRFINNKRIRRRRMMIKKNVLIDIRNNKINSPCINVWTSCFINKINKKINKENILFEDIAINLLKERTKKRIRENEENEEIKIKYRKGFWQEMREMKWDYR